MDRNIQLTLTACQHDVTGEDTIAELSYEAQYFERDGAHYILYEETTEDGISIKGRIKLKDHLLEVTRRGGVNSCMIFEAGREHATEYGTPFGSLQMRIFTHSLEVHPSDNEMAIVADYSLVADGAEISRCKISINIKNIV